MSPRYSQVYGETFSYAFWLVFGVDGSMRFSRGEPAVGRGERAMSCEAKLPRSLFRIPDLSATITLGEGVPSDFQIDVKAASDALKAAIGVDVDLRIQSSEGA